MELLKDIEEKAKELQVMIDEPASKEWFEKYPNAFKSEVEQEINEDLKN